MIKFILVGYYLVNPDFISALRDKKLGFSETPYCTVYVSGAETGTKYGAALTINVEGTCNDFVKKIETEIKNER